MASSRFTAYGRFSRPSVDRGPWYSDIQCVWSTWSCSCYGAVDVTHCQSVTAHRRPAVSWDDASFYTLRGGGQKSTPSEELALPSPRGADTSTQSTCLQLPGACAPRAIYRCDLRAAMAPRIYLNTTLGARANRNGRHGDCSPCRRGEHFEPESRRGSATRGRPFDHSSVFSSRKRPAASRM
jgi:hypothetical protein